MTEKEYYAALGEIRGSRKNEIISAVQNRLPKEEVKFNCPAEEMFFNSLCKQADEHMKKLGFFPTFDLYEIESDDPILDIYSDPV